MTGNLASAAISAISRMDALRIKCNKAEKEVEKKKGVARKEKEKTSLSGQTLWTKGLGAGCPVVDTLTCAFPGIWLDTKLFVL